MHIVTKRARFIPLVAIVFAAVFLTAAAPAAAEERRVIPGGASIGVEIETPGLIVTALEDVAGEAGPAEKAGIRVGDAITGINGLPIGSAAALSRAAESGEAMRLSVERNGQTREVTVTPAKSSDGRGKLGVWIRDGAAGIGVLTYYDPASLTYGALGHAVTDPASSVVLPTKEGSIYENRVTGVRQGRRGVPGEIEGDFAGQGSIGSVAKNTELGIYGSLTRPVENTLYPDGIPVAEIRQIRPGPAQILTTLSDGVLRAYDCEISRLFDQSEPTPRSMVLTVTDENLLRQTGGIVQGMSGSPIVQNGRLVGAVTHVFVNDPTRGFGVYITNMMAEEDEIRAAA